MASDIIPSSRWAAHYLFRVRPAVHRELARVTDQARRIPEPGPRGLALESLRTKRFHCEGGAVLAASHPRLIRLVVAYQTLCDYLDSVTDRGPAVTGDLIRRLHGALKAAMDPERPLGDPWQDHPWDDGGYLVWLTERCRQIVRTLPGWAAVQSAVGWLVDRYVDLQSIKHAPDREQRARALEAWYRTERRGDADVSWWEWAAATGSTLGLFALVSEAMTERPDADRVAALMDTYFPWMGGLHILLDYFIDQEEDRSGGDFNFVTCYANVEATVNGIARLHREACARADRLADAGFHRYIARGLLGFYLADRKVSGPLVDPARRLLATGGGISRGLWALARVGRAP